MNTPAKVRLIAIAFVAIIVVVYVHLLPKAGPLKIVYRSIGLVSICFMAYSLIRRKAWARSAVSTALFLGCLASIIAGVAMIAHVGHLPSNVAWGFAMGAAYGVMGVCLTYSKDIRDYFIREAEDAPPNSRQPLQVSTSPEDHTSDSRREPPSGGCG